MSESRCASHSLRPTQERPDADECSAELIWIAPVEGRKVGAAFDGGAIRSDAGALLLGTPDRAIGLMDRFAGYFDDIRRPQWIEHKVITLVRSGVRKRAGAEPAGGRVITRSSTIRRDQRLICS
jgi:hypothetical protein